MNLGVFECVFILNLDKRKQQGEELQYLVESKGGKCSRILVGDGNLKEKYFYVDKEKPQNWIGNNQTYNYTMCWKSLLHFAKSNKINNFLFLEDDATFVDGFDDKFDSLYKSFKGTVTNWDMLYLGSNQLPEDSWLGYKGLKTKEIATGILRSARARDMHAVAVNHTMYMPLLALFDEKWLPGNPSFDETVCHALHHKHFVYAFKPSLVLQKPGFSYNKGAYDDRTHSW